MQRKSFLRRLFGDETHTSPLSPIPRLCRTNRTQVDSNFGELHVHRMTLLLRSSAGMELLVGMYLIVRNIQPTPTFSRDHEHLIVVFRNKMLTRRCEYTCGLENQNIRIQTESNFWR